MSAQRHLKPVPEADTTPGLMVVNPTTGETMPLERYTQPLEDQMAGLVRDNKGWAQRYAELKRDLDAEAEESTLWPAAVRVFNYWRETCNHARSVFTRDRFELIAPFLEKYGNARRDPEQRLIEAEALCRRAIRGAAHDPFVTTRKNGSKKRHDGIDLIFRNADKFEEFCNRAPITAPPPTRGVEEHVESDDDAEQAGADDGSAGGGEQGSLIPD